MKDWFNKLNKKKKGIISISFLVSGILTTLIGIYSYIYYIFFISIPLLVLGILFTKWNKNVKKASNNTEFETNRLNQNKEDLIQYNLLKSNNFDISNVKCNFECSLRIMALNLIKSNQFFNPLDFKFNIENKISEYKEIGFCHFKKSKFKNFISLDLETTGLDIKSDRIVQISLVKIINGEIKETYGTYINPMKHISVSASEINGIYDADVKNEKSINELFPEIFNFIGTLPIVAHNAKFDIGILKNEWKRYFNKKFPNNKIMCTMELWKLLFNYFQNESPPSAKLSTLVINLLDEEDIKTFNKNKHNANCDALVTAKVFMKMYDDNYLNLLK